MEKGTTETWKSPRRIEEEVKEYYHTRFEWYMQRVDNSEILLEDAITELKREIEVAESTVLKEPQ